jgi:hypothetical protein
MQYPVKFSVKIIHPKALAGNTKEEIIFISVFNTTFAFPAGEKITFDHFLIWLQLSIQNKYCAAANTF